MVVIHPWLSRDRYPAICQRFDSNKRLRAEVECVPGTYKWNYKVYDANGRCIFAGTTDSVTVTPVLNMCDKYLDATGHKAPSEPAEAAALPRAEPAVSEPSTEQPEPPTKASLHFHSTYPEPAVEPEELAPTAEALLKQTIGAALAEGRFLLVERLATTARLEAW